MAVPELNLRIAQRLDEVADLLREQEANPFRVRAYHRAAQTLRRTEEPADRILDERGVRGLEELPGVGESLAGAIRDVVRTGRLPMLERLRGEADPVALLMTVPGIGRKTAERLHRGLDIDSLAGLEAAAHDRRLEQFPGMGPKRLAGIVATLRERLGRVRPPRPRDGEEPPVAELLEVDREYRDKAARGALRRIAPQRFNPEGKAWLPILHSERGGSHYTALFSNTPLAHELGRTNDWVVLYCDGPRGERQYTVVTSRRGALEGKRAVRSREKECLAYYQQQAPSSA